jgi:hypothetical protein
MDLIMIITILCIFSKLLCLGLYVAFFVISVHENVVVR